MISSVSRGPKQCRRSCVRRVRSPTCFSPANGAVASGRRRNGAHSWNSASSSSLAVSPTIACGGTTRSRYALNCVRCGDPSRPAKRSISDGIGRTPKHLLVTGNGVLNRPSRADPVQIRAYPGAQPHRKVHSIQARPGNIPRPAQRYGKASSQPTGRLLRYPTARLY